MRMKPVVAIACVFALAGCRFSLDRALEAGDVRGALVFERVDGTRTPASGASVSVLGAPGRVKADGRGRFVLRGLPPASHVLRIAHDLDGDGTEDGAIRLPVTLPALGDGRASGVDLGEVVVSAFGAISGRVLRNGLPVDGARVVLVATGQVFTVAGSFAFDAVPAGTHEVAVALEEGGGPLVTAPRTVEVRPRDTATLDFDLDTVALETTGQASGLALLGGQRTHDGTRIRLVRAADSLDAAETSADGLWAGTHVRAGVYTLVAEANGYATGAVPFIVLAGEIEAPTLTLATESTPCGLEGNPLDPADPDGDGATGEPAACACDPSGSRDLDADGLCDTVDPDVLDVRPSLSFVSSTPADGATDVPADATLSLVFDAPLRDDTVSASTISVASGGDAVPVTFVVDDARVFIRPDAQGWSAGASIEVTVTTALRSRQGARLADPVSLSFRVAGGTTATLSVLGTDPDSGETGVALDRPLVLTFDADVRRDSVTSSTVRVRHGADEVAGAFDVQGAVVTFVPDAGWPAGATIDVLVTTGVTSTAGAPLDNAWAFTFTTADVDVLQVASGGYHHCVRRAPGTLWCWGEGSDGQLGEGTFLPSSTPLQVGHDTDWTHVTAGLEFTCGLRASGSLWCWGTSGAGALGLGGIASMPVPAKVGQDEDWKAVAAGYAHVCALKDDGSLWCWGADNAGQGADGTADTQSSLEPKRVADGPYDILFAGGDTTCASRVGGGLWCWGRNSGNEAGTSTPSVVHDPLEVSTLAGWTGGAITYGMGCGLRAGELHCWGTGATPVTVLPADTETPVRVGTSTGYTSVALSQEHACAVRDGSLECWGANYLGQLGDGTFDDREQPVAVADGGPWVEAAAGWDGTCARDAAGTLRCFGSDYSGELGRGNGNLVMFPVETGAGTDFVEIAVGVEHACAIRSGGSLWCTGGEDGGGNGTDPARDLFEWTRVGEANDWLRVFSDGEATCGLRGSAGSTSGALWCFGGTLGPMAQRGTDTDWVDVSVADGHACGLKSDGKLWCFGQGARGVLFDGNTTARPDPVEVGGGLAYVDVSTGVNGTCAVRDTGELRCVGLNMQAGGQVTSPVTIPGRSDWAKVARGNIHQCALTRDGEAFCWGSNGYGELGNGAIGSTTFVLQAVRTRERFTDLVSMNSSTCARTADGRHACWGRARHLGIGSSGSLYGATPALVDGATSLDVGFSAGCAIRDGRVRCWGLDDGNFGMGPPFAASPRPVAFAAGCQDDAYEPDDAATPQRAFRPDSDTIARADGRLCDASPDVRALDVPVQGGASAVWVGVTHGTGPLTVEALAADGSTVLATTQATSTAPARLSVVSGDGSARFVRVSGSNATWTADALRLASDGCNTDAAEPNDTSAAATLLPAPPAAPSVMNRTESLTLCTGDEDWFAAGVKAAVPAIVRLAHFAAPADVELAFFEDDGTTPAAGVVAKPPAPERGYTAYEYEVTSTADRTLRLRVRLASGSALPWVPATLYTLR